MKHLLLSLTVVVSAGLLILCSSFMFAATPHHQAKPRPARIAAQHHKHAVTTSIQSVKAKQRRTPQQLRQRTAERQTRMVRRRIASTATRLRSGLITIPFPTSNTPAARQARSADGVIFFDDMENGVNGWTVDTHYDTVQQDPLWHLTERNANSPTHSWWAGDEATGTYSTGTIVNQSLVSPPIDLSGLTGSATLVFCENYITEPGWDQCIVDISTDAGATWNTLSDATDGSGNSNGWTIASMDISANMNHAITIRFHFNSLDSFYNDYPGWFIDNVMVVNRWGTVSGNIFFDLDQNGAHDGSELPLRGWPVTAAGNGLTMTTPTDDQGNYSFVLPYGQYTISEDLQPGWTQTAPATGSWTVTIDPSTSPGNVDFGNWRTAAHLSGIMFDDINQNGVRESGEKPEPDQEVDLEPESDFSSDEQYMNTDLAGLYTFAVHDTGWYDVNQYSDYDQTFPLNGAGYRVHVTDLGINNADLNFGVYDALPLATISGQVFYDLNRNGVKDSNETGMFREGVILDGDDNREVYTDNNGYYSFKELYGGNYTVYLDEDEDYWNQTVPHGDYRFRLADTTTIDTANFGGYYLSATASISGIVFMDANENGVKDSNEVALHGVEVILDGDDYQETYTDYGGGYSFGDLWEGLYTVSIQVCDRYATTKPQGPYQISLPDGAHINADFGLFEMFPNASVSGKVFNDANDDGVKGAGESGIAGWRVALSGTTRVGKRVLDYCLTDANGAYTFPYLWPGRYTIMEQLRPQWRQTLPAGFGSIPVTLGNGAIASNQDFGNHYDSTFNLAFRSFLPETLALARDPKGKLKWTPIKKMYPLNIAFSAAFVNHTGASALTLTFGLNLPVVGAIAVTPSGSQSYTPDNKSYTVTFNGGLPDGDSVWISGIAREFKQGDTKTLSIGKGKWGLAANHYSLATVVLPDYEYSYIPPNAVDLLMAMNIKNLQIGSVAAQSVLLKKYSDIGKSLLYKNQMHNGPPTCFCYYQPYHAFIKQVTSFQPKYDVTNNKLFSEAIALKISIMASDLGVTPEGFGDLIYDEGGDNPLNGKSVRTIFDTLNNYLSSNTYVPPRGDRSGFTQCHFPPGYEWLDSLKLWQTVRNIDSAFCGPADFDYWIPEKIPHLSLTPERALAAVPYLHLDSTLAHGGERRSVLSHSNAKPKRFELLQNYPNPFNPVTSLSFILPHPSIVTLRVYDILGQEVATVLNRQEMDEGEQDVEFDGGMLASGVYFYRIEVDINVNEDEGITAAHYTGIKKMMLVK